jgi:hypothetical protein
MLERSLRRMTLDHIVDGCRSESNQPRAEETGYCFELFRRALEEDEQAAWQAIDQQYKHLILHWIYSCSPNLPREEIDEIAPQALPKFWKILTKSTTPVTHRFAHVGAILKYLKQCAVSVLRDHERRAQRRERIRTKLQASGQQLARRLETEQELLARVDQEKLLQMVRNWVKTYVTDPQEQRVLVLSFEIGLSPSQIVQHYPQEFPDVQTVRRIKERLLKRARRAMGDTVQVNGNGSSLPVKPTSHVNLSREQIS